MVLYNSIIISLLGAEMQRLSVTSSLIKEYVDVTGVGFTWRLLQNGFIIGVHPHVVNWMSSIGRVVTGINTFNDTSIT